MINLDILKDLAPGDSWVECARYPRHMVSSKGKVFSLTSYKLLKSSINSRGYLVVRLRISFGKYKSEYVHRLVAQSFIRAPKKGETVNHKNGIKIDNCALNLEYLSIAENVRHANLLGIKRANSTESQVINVIKLLEEGVGQKEISLKTGCSTGVVTEINCGRSHRSISERIVKSFPISKRSNGGGDNLGIARKLIQEGRIGATYRDLTQAGKKFGLNIGNDAVPGIRAQLVSDGVLVKIGERYKLSNRLSQKRD